MCPMYSVFLLGTRFRLIIISTSFNKCLVLPVCAGQLQLFFTLLLYRDAVLPFSN